MKKYIWILLALIFLLGACSTSSNEESTTETEEPTETQEETSDTYTEDETEEESKPEEVEETEEKDLEKEKEPGKEPVRFDIQLNTETNEVKVISDDGEVTVLADNNPSEPLTSPNGDKAAYISPLGWEELSDLYLVDLHDGSQQVLVPFDSNQKPKDLLWEDDEHVLVILGPPYGTVDVGGNIYRVNIESREKEELTTYSGDMQITQLERIEDGVLYYSGIQYTDDNANESEEYTNQLTLE